MLCFLMGLNAFFHNVLKLGVYPAFVVAYPLALLVHYFLNKRWTFGSKQAATRNEVKEYVIMVAITAVIQLTAFAFFTARWPGLPNWISAGFASATQMIFSFLLMQQRVFNQKRADVAVCDSAGRLSAGALGATFLLFFAIALLYAWTISPEWSAWKFPAFESDSL